VSITASPAVACGTHTLSSPSRAPTERRNAAISPVRSTTASRPPVRISISWVSTAVVSPLVREAFGAEFDVPDGYLNTASIGIPPAAAGAAVAEAITAWRTGAGRAGEYDEPVARARQGFADLVGVDVARVAIGPAVSALVGLVATALPPGARVLVAAGEFTSVTWPFAAQAERGVEVTEVELAEVGRRAGEFDLVAVSVVQSADGRVVDLDDLRAARAGGTRVLLDATQSLGWLDADVSWADAVVAAGYKWLLSPRGVAWMAIRPELSAVPAAAGWYASAD